MREGEEICVWLNLLVGLAAPISQEIMAVECTVLGGKNEMTALVEGIFNVLLLWMAFSRGSNYSGFDNSPHRFLELVFQILLLKFLFLVVGHHPHQD